ncbi:MAG: GspE/PulE family protein [Candidatus Omnitrophota bacterium]
MDNSLRVRILKEILDKGLVKKDQIEKILSEAQGETDGDIINVFTESGLISDEDLLTIVSRVMGVPFLDVSRIELDPDIMDSIPEKLLKRHLIIPLSKIGNDLTIVIANPADVLAIDDIKAISGCNIKLALATHKNIQETLQSFYKTEEESLTEIITDEKGEDQDSVEFVSGGDDEDIAEIAKESKEAPIIKMVDLIISEALKKRASDIHIEPQENILRIRYRVDGQLHDVFDLPKKNQNAILARLKIMSNLDITETRIPQDGRFRIKTEKKEVDFRVSSLPTSFGNKIVLRALDRSNLSAGLEALGFLPEPLADFQTALTRPFGIILVTGPTGSGKSTTLYSVLNEMNTPDRNILTVEDPVEYQVGGLTQIAVHAEIGLDFTTGLRAILRQSPDVIMVGEIRDFETADIATKASLTGQLVLSTLHTNDSVGAITRLVNMGIEPFLIASSLIMACAQRLLRKLCPNCKQEANLPEKMLKEIREKYPESNDVKVFYAAAGCKRCNGTGYSGRLGTLETLLLDDEIRSMINKKESEECIKKYLREKNVKTLRENAMIKFIKGWTTLEEVLRVT